jgi:hypothetical protein
MPSKNLTPAPPVVAYVQWTGDNLAEVQDLVKIARANPMVDDDGQLWLFRDTSGQTPVPVNGWIAQRSYPDMPLWFSDEDFYRYQEIPQAQGYRYDITGS